MWKDTIAYEQQEWDRYCQKKMYTPRLGEVVFCANCDAEYRLGEKHECKPEDVERYAAEYNNRES